MAKSIPALVEPELLRWARKTAGLSETYVVQRMFPKKPETGIKKLASWEAGEERPTVAQLKKLGSIYKRPIAVFYLPKPPKDFAALHDFRFHPEGEEESLLSPQLVEAIREVQMTRDLASDLSKYFIPVEISNLLGKATLDSNIKTLAKTLRKIIGISIEDQEQWRDGYAAYTNWRKAIEHLGIFTFQVNKISTKEMRGFSIIDKVHDKDIPIIVINSKDAVLGRVFTLFHELGHLLLKKTGICNLKEDKKLKVFDRRSEAFCNQFAASFLMPKEDLENDPIVIKKRGSLNEWEDFEIDALTKKFKVSRLAILTRLKTLKFITQAFYNNKREEIENEPSPPKSFGIAPPYRRVISKKGEYFTRVVIEAYSDSEITAVEVADMLDFKLKHLPELEQRIIG